MTLDLDATRARDLKLLQLLHDGTPVSVAGPQVGVSASDAHAIATEYGYPNRRKLANAIASLQGCLQGDPAPVQDEPVRPELPDTDQAGVDLPHPGEAGPDPDERQPVLTAERFNTLCRAQLLSLVERAKTIDSQPLTNSAQSILERYDNLVPKLVAAETRYGNAARIAELQAELAKLRGATKASPDRTKTVGVKAPAAKAVRAWARSAGVECNDAGRVAQHVIDQYLKAQEGDA